MDHLKLTIKKSPSNLSLDNEDTNIEDQSPSFHHLAQQQIHQGLISSPLLPQSPESLWSPSPFSSPTHHPSLLYCCISSLRHEGGVYSIMVSGDLVLTGSSSRRVHAWQSLDCRAKGYLQASSGDVRAMVAQGNMLYTSHKDHKIRVWKMYSSSSNNNNNNDIICHDDITMNNNNNNNFKPKKVTTLPNVNHFKNFLLRPNVLQHKDTISCMAYYHAEGILYTGSLDKTVKAWKLSERKCINSFVAHTCSINDMVINQQNGYLFTCSSDGTVKMWLKVYGETSHAPIKVLTHHKHPIYALALSTSTTISSQFLPHRKNSNNNSCYLYSGSFDGSINFWEQNEDSCQYNQGKKTLQGHEFAVLCLVTLKNLVMSGSEDATIRIWRRSEEKEKNNRVKCSHECIAVLEGHRGPVRCLQADFSQKDVSSSCSSSSSVLSFLVFSASTDQTFKVWRVKLLSDVKNNNINNNNSSVGVVQGGNKGDDHCVEGRKSFELERAPPLSPSWVRKKMLQCRSVR